MNDIIAFFFFKKIGPDIPFSKNGTLGNTQEMQQSCSTTFPKHQKKERYGTNKEKTNATDETTDARRTTMTEKLPWNDQ